MLDPNDGPTCLTQNRPLITNPHSFRVCPANMRSVYDEMILRCAWKLRVGPTPTAIDQFSVLRRPYLRP